MLGHLPLSGWLIFVKLAHDLTRRCYCCSCRERAQCSAVCRLSYLLGGRGKRVLVRVLPLADNSWRECNERPCIEHGRCMINAAASFYFSFIQPSHWMNVILFFITKPTAYCFLRRPDSRSLSARTISVITLMDMQYERCVQANRADHTSHRQRP